MRRILILIAMLASMGFAEAKPTYKITLQIEGATDSVVYIGYYRGQNRYICDTAFNNGKGKFVFEGKRELEPGMYFFTNDRDRLVEFVVYHEKLNFKFKTDEHNWNLNMTVKGSHQNEVLYNYQRASYRLYTETEEARRNLDSAAFVAFQHKQRLRLDSVQYDILERYPESMIAKMMAATKDIDVPTVDSDGNTLTPRQRYEYVLAHYFDNMPLDDDFLVRTPKTVFYQRVMDYVDKTMHGLPPAMICPLLDSLIDRSEPAPEVFKWLVMTLTEKYLQSNIMVYDEVYVHLVQRYFATGKMPWLPPSAIDKEVERANKWERLLVGRVAPELILFDTLQHPHSLYRMPGDFTLLIFWSPTCGHCREIIPALYNEFEKVADSLNMSAFAILTEPDDHTVVKWKKFLADHGMTDPRWVNLNGGEANVDWREVYDITTTPQVYLIDNRDHKFLAKKLNASLFKTICKDIRFMADKEKK